LVRPVVSVAEKLKVNLVCSWCTACCCERRRRWMMRGNAELPRLFCHHSPMHAVNGQSASLPTCFIFCQWFHLLTSSLSALTVL